MVFGLLTTRGKNSVKEDYSLLAIYCGQYFGWIKYNLQIDQQTNKFGVLFFLV